MRTTVDIDDPILRELKRLQEREGKSLGRLVSDLLAFALKQRASDPRRERSLDWTVRDMGARYDLADRDAVLDALDTPSERRSGSSKRGSGSSR